jgi:hypothetical protein
VRVEITDKKYPALLAKFDPEKWVATYGDLFVVTTGTLGGRPG